MNASILTKADMRRAYPFGLLKVSKSKLATYHESSGTEGSPISSYFTAKDWEDVASRFLRSSIGLNSSDTFFIKTPYSMVTTAHQAHRAGEMVKCLIIPGDNRTTLMPYSRVVQVLKSLEVTVTWSLPSEVLLWGLAAQSAGLDPKKDFPHLRAFWVAGEALSPARKELLSNLWGGKLVIEDYGSTETGSLAGECNFKNLHVWADRIRFEIYDDETEVVSNFGTGQLLVTTLFREAMPLARYLIEDEVTLEPSACKCHSKLPVIRVHGRRSSQIEVQGRKFLPKDLEQVVCEAGFRHGLLQWKAAYDSDVLEIEIAATEAGPAAKEISENILNKLCIRAAVRAYPLSHFISPELFNEKLQFSKPNYIFRRTP